MILVTTLCSLISFSPNVLLVQKINILPIILKPNLIRFQSTSLWLCTDFQSTTALLLHVLSSVAGELPSSWIPSRSASGVTIICIYKGRTFEIISKFTILLLILSKKKKNKEVKSLLWKRETDKKLTDFVRN